MCCTHMPNVKLVTSFVLFARITSVFCSTNVQEKRGKVLIIVLKIPFSSHSAKATWLDHIASPFVFPGLIMHTDKVSILLIPGA